MIWVIILLHYFTIASPRCTITYRLYSGTAVLVGAPGHMPHLILEAYLTIFSRKVAFSDGKKQCALPKIKSFCGPWLYSIQFRRLKWICTHIPKFVQRMSFYFQWSFTCMQKKKLHNIHRYTYNDIKFGFMVYTEKGNVHLCPYNDT